MLHQTNFVCAALFLSLATAVPTEPLTKRSVHTDLSCVTEGGTSFWLGDVATSCPAPKGAAGIGPEQAQVCCTQTDGGNPCKRIQDGGCNGSSAVVPSVSIELTSSQTTPSVAPNTKVDGPAQSSVTSSSTTSTQVQTSQSAVGSAVVKLLAVEQSSSTSASQAVSTAVNGGELVPVFGGAQIGTGYPTNKVFDYAMTAAGSLDSGKCVVADQGNDAAFGGATYSGGDMTVYPDDATHAACITAPGTTSADGSIITVPADLMYVAVSYCLMDRVPSASLNPAKTTMCGQKVQINGG